MKAGQKAGRGSISGLNKQQLLRISRLAVKHGWFPAVCLAALFIGLSVGYVFLGGQSAGEMFQISTWKHLFDLVFAEQ